MRLEPRWTAPSRVSGKTGKKGLETSNNTLPPSRECFPTVISRLLGSAKSLRKPEQPELLGYKQEKGGEWNGQGPNLDAEVGGLSGCECAVREGSGGEEGKICEGFQQRHRLRRCAQGRA